MAGEPIFWLEVVKAVSTPIVALAAAIITGVFAYRQWQTANEKVVLDLLQRRLEVHDLITDAITSVNQEGSSNIDHRQLGPLARGIRQAKFLFGKEVNDYLDDLWLSVLKLKSVSRRLPSAADDKVDALVKQEDESYEKISNFYKDFDRLLIPYMRMDQKLSRFRLFRRL